MVKSKPIVGMPEVKGLLHENRDFLKDLLREVIQETLESEMDDAFAARKNERTSERIGYRSGYDPWAMIPKAVSPFTPQELNLVSPCS
ncbi:MAG: transposase [Desulfobulbaceae bacterium]|jgi:putative transposase